MTEMAECIVHMTDFDDECEMCTSQVEDLNDAYMKQLAKNERLEQGLQTAGAQMNPLIMFSLKQDMIMTIITNGNPKIRLKLETDFAKQVEQLLMDANQQAVRQKLTNGVNPGMKIK